MRILRKVFVLSLALIALLGFVGCEDASKRDLEGIKKSEELIIGVFSDKVPFGYLDSNNKNLGYDVYLGKRLAKDLLGDESKVKFVTLEAANRIEYLQTNKVDIILANFTVTEARKEQVDFAKPYMKVALGLVAPNGGVTSIEDLKQDGKKLIVNAGTTAEIYFKANHPDIELLIFEQNTEAFNALKDGRGHALAHDNTLLFAWAFSNSGYKVVNGSIGSQDQIAPAVKKGNTDLLNWINERITKLTEEKFFEKAYNAELKSHFSSDTKKEDIIYTLEELNNLS